MINRPNIPGAGMQDARAALDSMKLEIASELGIDLKQYHKGDLPSRVAGSMVKRMIEQQEKDMSGKGK